MKNRAAIGTSLYEFALNNVHEAAFLIDKNAQFLYVNDECSRYLGYSKEELLNMSVMDIDPDINLESWKQHWANLIRDQAVLFEREHLTKSGSLVPVEVSANYFQFNNEEYNLALVRDITERKTREAEVNLLKYALDLFPAGVYLKKNFSPYLMYVNKTVCEELGYSYEEITGGMSIFDINPDIDEAAWHQYIRDIKEQGHLEFETRHRRRDGELFPVQITSSFFEFNNDIYSLAISQNIAKRKAMENELDQYRHRLEETVEQRTEELKLARDNAEAANNAKSIFLANMSHELRTPLNAILGFSQLLSMDDNIPEEQLSDIHIINQSGEHLLKLINDVLEMSKIESGTIALAMDDAAIQPMLEDVVTLLSPHAETKGIQLTLTLDDKCPDTVFCDINKLRQVVINLIGNAIKFTEQGHVQIRLSLAMMKKNELLIEVQDSGPGIENDDLSRVFMPFEQIIRNATTGGTGLGLSISKQFVELMGGEITVASGIGQGCIFTVHLPLRHNNAVTETQHAADKSLKLSPETRVLVVEDQKENQLLFIKMLNQAGCQSRLAENGVQAIQLYEEWQPDVILMDRKMPVMDGLEATQIIRTLSKGDQVIIIGVTASAFKEEQNELISAGMDAVMAKPFKLEALSQLIIELLEDQE